MSSAFLGKRLHGVSVEKTSSFCLGVKYRTISLLDDIWMILSEVELWNDWGRSKCDKCIWVVRDCSQRRFTTVESISNYRNSCPTVQQWSSMSNHVSRRPIYWPEGKKEQAADTGKNRKTRGIGDCTTDIAIYRGLGAAQWWSVCTSVVCTINTGSSEKAFLWCREYHNWIDNQWGSSILYGWDHI